MGIPTHILVFGLSVLLHIGVVGIGLFQLSSSKPVRIDLSKPVVYQVDLVTLAPPAPGRPAPLTPAAPSPPPAAREQPRPAPAPKEVPPPPPPPQPKAEIPVPEAPKPTPAPKPAPQPEPKPDPKPEPKPEAKPEPPKPAPPPPKAPEPTPPRQPQRTEPSRGDIMAEALGAVQQDVSRRTQSNARDEALASLRQSGATGPGGADGQDRGVGYGGLLEVYAQMVESRVKAQWRFPKGASRQDLSAVLEISLDRDGRVLGSRVVRSSGHSGFDASVERAVEETGQLPPPPRDDLRSIRITFNLQEL